MGTIGGQKDKEEEKQKVGSNSVGKQGFPEGQEQQQPGQIVATTLFTVGRQKFEPNSPRN